MTGAVLSTGELMECFDDGMVRCASIHESDELL